MKRFSLVAVTLVLLAAISAAAAPNVEYRERASFPRHSANARYVYVASYDGDQFDQNLVPEDRNAIRSVQDPFKSGQTGDCVPASEADMIILVTSRSSEDLMAVYDAHPWPSGSYLWRVMGRKVSSPAKFRWSLPI